MSLTFPPLDFVNLVLLLGAFCIGLSKGGMPAIGMVAVPLASLTTSPLVSIILLLPIFIITDLVGILLYYKVYSKANLRILIPAALFGIILGWVTVVWINDQLLGLGIGITGLVFCFYNWMPFNKKVDVVQPVIWKGMMSGIISGFTSFICHAGAPPYQLYILPQKLEKMVYIGTTTLFFSSVNLMKIVPYYYLQDSLYIDFTILIWTGPVALVGCLLGTYLVRRIDAMIFFKVTVIGLFLVSTQLVYKSLV